MFFSHTSHGGEPRKPQPTNTYLIGGGIASLAAAVHLIHDAHIPASHIHILESSKYLGGSMHFDGSPEAGYILQSGQKLDFSYECLHDLLSTIPSATDPAKTIMQEMQEFKTLSAKKPGTNARLVASGADGPQIVDTKHLGLRTRDGYNLIRLVMKPEKELQALRIVDCFKETFFRTNFWLMWSALFAFQSWHSAVEFRRCLRRFFRDIPRISTLKGVYHSPYNLYDSLILPTGTYLKAQGVDFQYNTKVLRLSFIETPRIKVEEIHFIKDGSLGSIRLEDSDIVFSTLGSIASCRSIGSNLSPPAPLPPIHNGLRAPDGAWELWTSLFWSPFLKNSQSTQLGNPKNFYSRVKEACLLSFTVTLKNAEFFNRFEKWSGDASGIRGITTFKDSNWLMSIVIPHQPFFLNQPDNVHVFWGYALSPERFGNIIRKPMMDCTGEEIFTELLGLLNFPAHPTLESAITIPCLMPYMTSQLLTRSYKDRPLVIPKGCTNLALLGQFVEIPGETVCTMEYSIRTAQIAVSEMMGVHRKPTDIYKREHILKDMAHALKTLLV